MYQVQSLKGLSTTSLIKDINRENALEYFLIATKFNVERLSDKCCKKIAIKQTSNSNEFKELPLKYLKALLSHPYFNPPEDDKYRAVVKWLQYDQTNRQIHFDDVMSLFCYHKLSSKVSYQQMHKLYQKNGRKRSYDEVCSGYLGCPENHIKEPSTLEELKALFGNRCIQLAENLHMVNSFKYKYGSLGRKVPKEMNKLRIGIERGCHAGNYTKNSLEQEIMFGDHHVEVFFQNTKDADHTFIVTGDYNIQRGCYTFVQLPKVCLILGLQPKAPPNPELTHKTDPSKDTGRMLRYPMVCVIGGSEVDMDDAIRFACSLNLRNHRCDICQRIDKDNYRFMNIWSASAKKVRYQHLNH